MRKIGQNILSTKVTATKYINIFLSYTKQLKDLDVLYTKSKTISLFLEKITDPDNQNYSQNAPNTEIQYSHIIIEEKKLEDEDNIVNISKYKTELGYYSIPKEIWITLNNQD